MNEKAEVETYELSVFDKLERMHYELSEHSSKIETMVILAEEMAMAKDEGNKTDLDWCTVFRIIGDIQKELEDQITEMDMLLAGRRISIRMEQSTLDRKSSLDNAVEPAVESAEASKPNDKQNTASDPILKELNDQHKISRARSAVEDQIMKESLKAQDLGMNRIELLKKCIHRIGFPGRIYPNYERLYTADAAETLVMQGGAVAGGSADKPAISPVEV